MDRGQLGGLSYEIGREQRPMMSSPMAAQQAVEYEAPEYSNDPLAVREKITSDYYNNMGLLRSFAMDMAKQGIDVTQPDYTQDGGGPAFQTFQKLQAGLMFAANALKNEFQKEKQIDQAVLTGHARRRRDFDPTREMYIDNPDAAYSTQLDPRTVAANQRTAQNVYTQTDANNLNRAVYNPTYEALGQSGFGAEEQEYQQSGLMPSVAETSYQQLIPRGGSRSRGGLSDEDIFNRAELIKQVKRGILTKDQTPINMLKLVPGVEDIEYVNTGDKVGMQIYVKGQAQPSFIDLSEGKGEGDINAFLNRIEGQKNVPNEAVFKFDTAVKIPKSNARQILDDVKTKLGTLPNSSEIANQVFPKIQEIAAQGGLVLPSGEPIVSVDMDVPRFFGSNKLVVTYYPIKNGKVNYSKKMEKSITDKAELENFIEFNANSIAPEFGGGFVENEQPTSKADAAVAAFVKQFNRQPNPTELAKIQAKYK